MYSCVVLSRIQKGQPNDSLAQNTLLGSIITNTTCSQAHDHLHPSNGAADICEGFCFDSPYLAWLRELFDELSYFDDFFGGVDIKRRDALTISLSAAKIPLGKWSINYKDLRPGLTDIDQTKRFVNLNELTNALGIK